MGTGLARGAGCQPPASASADGVPFLMHDAKLTRTTNVQDEFPARAAMNATTFNWTELQQLDAGSWFLEVGCPREATWLRGEERWALPGTWAQVLAVLRAPRTKAPSFPSPRAPLGASSALCLAASTCPGLELLQRWLGGGV